MKTEPNEQAFPMPGSQSNAFKRGLTKREYFAGLAMQGLLVTKAVEHLRPEFVAARSVVFADALIAALNAEGSK